MRYIFPYVFALVYWLLFFVAGTVPQVAYYMLTALCIWAVVTVGVVDGMRWYRHWNTWLQFILLLVSSFFFSLIVISPALRQLYIMAGGVVLGFFVYILLRYSHMTNVFLARSYLLVMSFLYIITFWQCAAILFFIIVSYDANSLIGVAVFGLLTYILGRGSIFDYGLKKSSSRLVLSVLVLTTSELSAILTLLPIHYYTLATLLTVWFFFVVHLVIIGQDIPSRKRVFQMYLLLFFITYAAVLLTATWQ